ncbi:sigma-E processing peptidase SpoIIGA [Oceanirhabdus seepicola]|uniref:Sporulation sigma-E factor-processing peptidase n=1 Tax=Oceanirhabdus seepicola TaxID=2828781 RepID=A0A9J6P2Z7_9CLOT|nr:sigma-E processing peptidase SpoIIGA [Oceanirhabdus seepicola]MCM1990883.1 sigma-E processing peptidase SpoIIGA [Oceanirhabdus seepicola]
MVVNIDVFILENLIINYFLLITTGRIQKKKVRVWRCVLGALVGVIYSIIVLVVRSEILSNTILKLIMGLGMVMIAFQKKEMGLKQLLKLWLAFIIVSFVLSGAFLFVHVSLGKGVIFRGMFLNFTYKGLIVAILIIAIFFERIYYFINEQRIKAQYIYTVKIIKEDKQIELKALLDTGNFLTEPISGKGVIVIESKKYRELYIQQKDCYRIPYSCVDNKVEYLYGFQPDAVRIINKKGEDQELIDILIAGKKGEFEEAFQGVLPSNVLLQLK